MVSRTLWRVGALVCACLALGTLCGFALPVPEDWLARDPDFSPQGVEVFRSLEALRAAAPEDAFVIGGGAVYAQLLPWCDTAYVTRLERTFPADTYFPDLDADPAWRLTETEGPYEHQGLVFRYDTYRRI